MLAVILFILGLVAIVVAVAMLAGLWWGVLLAGIFLVGGGVLTNMGERKAPETTS